MTIAAATEVDRSFYHAVVVLSSEGAFSRCPVETWGFVVAAGPTTPVTVLVHGHVLKRATPGGGTMSPS